MSDSTRIEFPARDGTTLRGDYYKAEGSNVPVAVMGTGFSLLKESNAGFAREIAKAGISVLAFDYHSFGSSDGMPRQEIDLYRQAEDFEDAVTAVRNFPGVDLTKIILWGVGHGASVAMIVGGRDPRLKAVVMHVPFPSGAVDAAGYPAGLLERAWRDLEEKTKSGDKTASYAKVWRDWENDADGDEGSVFIKGPAAYGFQMGTKADAASTGTPWENQVTLRSFLNVAGTETQDFIHRVKYPTIYVTNQNDPLAPSADVQKSVFSKMGTNAQFREIPQGPGGLFEQLGNGNAQIIEWVKSVI